jgi:hypothetical protein
MKLLRIFLPTTILAIAALIISSTPTEAKPELTKKEKKPCTACHVKNGNKELNDAGKHYKEKGKLP